MDTFIIGLLNNPLRILIIIGVIVFSLIMLIAFRGDSIWLPTRIREFIGQPRIVFIRFVNEMPQLAGTKWLKKGTKRYVRQDKIYIFDEKKMAFSFYGNPIYFFDIDKCVPIPFGKIDERLKDSTKVMKTALETKIFKDYVGSQSDKIYLIIIGILVIAVIGVGLYGQYQLNQQNVELLKLTNKIAQLMVNATQGGNVVIK